MLPLFLTIKMSESDKSKSFIDNQKAKYGKILYIEKVIRPDRKGEPDIFAIFKGMPVYAEAKLINSISYRNLYPFKELQIDSLAIKAKAGAMCIGILYKDNEIRYLMHYDLKEYLDKSDWDKAEVFDWETLKLRWTESVLSSF
jgi:penicillin-binding protein-related factor A (putative recombinase)